MNTSPADLVVAFRSLPRRLDEATTADSPPEAVESATAEVHEAITAAATQLDAAATAEGVAAAIDHRLLTDWTDDEISKLQGHAIAAATAIRTLENESGRG